MRAVYRGGKITTGRRERVAVAGVLAALVTAAVAVPAAYGASSPTGKPPTPGKPIAAVDAGPDFQARVKVQSRLDAIDDRIRHVATDTPASGLGNIVNDDDHGTITLYWHGALPQAVAAEVTRAAHLGTTVTVIPSAYTWNQMEAESRRLIGQNDKLQAASGVRVATIGPAIDANGLTAETARPDTGNATAKAANAVNSATVARTSPLLASTMPVAYTDGGISQPTLRENDVPLYWAGGVMRTGNNFCSTGFAVHNGSTDWLLTADHCGNGNWANGDGSWNIGPSDRHAPYEDLQSVRAISGSGPFVWDGPGVAQAGQFDKPVIGSAATTWHDYYCASGAYNGAVCNVQVTAMGVEVDMNGQEHFNMEQGTQINNRSVSGSGDSGGPVFALNSGYTADYAVGILSSNDPSGHGVPCAGYNSNCSSRVYWTDFQYGLNQLGGGYSLTTD